MPIISEVPLTPVDIIIDSREAAKNKDVVEVLKRKGVKVAISALTVGDYYLLAPEGRKPILVERKTVMDFLNSIRDKRVWEQAKILKEAEEVEEVIPVIILEGSLSAIERFTKWRITAVLRILDELVLSWNIRVIPTPNRKSTIEWLVAKIKALGSPERKRPPKLRVKKKPMSINEQILYVAEGLVGPVLARKLLLHFKTLRNIANASVGELMRIEGIGEKRAKEIYAIFNTTWKPQDK
ncbi:MAG: hypothetical protein B6U76_02875 [Desulfurococcales archaeon ex4484_217_2]|nr:MAG: hypothetical protein B6U76_02875 [Desulfurococcales archaeon ex4484_217_2]